MSYVRLIKPYTRPCNLFKTFSHLVTAANCFIIIPSINSRLSVSRSPFRLGLNFSLYFYFWLPGQSDSHKWIEPGPHLIELLSPPSQHKSFKKSHRPKNSRPRCLQQFALITILFSLSTKPKQSLYLYEHFMDDNISYFQLELVHLAYTYCILI